MNLTGRLKRIEEKLSVGKEPNPRIIVVHRHGDEELLGPVREWLTFQEQLQSHGPESQIMLFVTRGNLEIMGRAKQRKATKNNQTGESRAAE